MYFRDYRKKKYKPEYIAKELGIKKDTLLAKERGDRRWQDDEIIYMCIKYKIKDITKVDDLLDLLK